VIRQLQMQKQRNQQLVVEIEILQKAKTTTNNKELVAENELYKQELLRLKTVIYELEHISKLSSKQSLAQSPLA
jgi:hypothetical protein